MNFKFRVEKISPEVLVPSNLERFKLKEPNQYFPSTFEILAPLSEIMNEPKKIIESAKGVAWYHKDDQFKLGKIAT